MPSRASALGPLQHLLADAHVSEVMVNGSGAVWVERAGALVATESHLSAVEVEALIERVLGPLGRRVDRSSPFADGRLADGSRVHVVVPPVAIDGPHLTIRRFRPVDVVLDDFADADRRRAVAPRRSTTPQSACQRRHERGQDHAAQRAGRLRRSQRTHHHDRRCGRAAAALCRTSCASKCARPTQRARARSTSASWCATPCACGPTDSSSAKYEEARRSTWCKR